MKKIMSLLVAIGAITMVYAQQSPVTTKLEATPKTDLPAKKEAGGAVSDAPKVSNPATPEIAKPTEDNLMLAETEYNFGKIPQGKPVTHVFVVSNKGKEPLKISNVQASCGCTTPVWEQDKPIPAGGSTNITVGYNAGAEGPFNKVVTITYNEGQSKQLFIKGEVWKTPTESAPANKTLEGLKN